MNESVEFFEGPPSFTDLVDRVIRKYGCRVDEMSLRGCFDCGKARAHYVLMNLASDSNWKHYKDVVHEANVACLEVIIEIIRMPGPNIVLREEVMVVNRNGETEYAFDFAIADDDFPNNTFERDEANIDDDDVSMGSEDSEFEEDGVVGVKAEEESLSQSAICESSMVNSKGIPFSESPVIKKRIKFKSLDELKFFLADYAVRLHRPLSVVHSDKNLRYNVMCKQVCHCRVCRSECTFSAQQNTLGGRILGIIRKDSEISVPSFVESIFAFSGYRIKYSKAWRAKQHAVALLWGDWKESYAMVPRVLTAMAYYNPEVKWFIDSCRMMHRDNGVLKHMLQRVFWCFPQCSEAFQHYRPVILVDGTFLTGKYKGTLMMAVGVDLEQHLVPLAFALAESENNESWSWFMQLVRRHVLGPSRQVCMISDRHHGLLNCAKDHMCGFPPLVHRWCTRHFAANMSRRQKTDRMIGKLKTLCKVHTEREFSEKLEDLVKDLNDDAKEWLKGEMEDKDKWACGTTNVGGESHGGRHYRVDLNEVSCTCNIPQLLHLPCSHFITACKAKGLNYESPLYMSLLYSREHTVRIWESSFQPYLDPSYLLLTNGVCCFFRMAAPAYPLFESTYDLQHRAYHLTDLHEDLKPLRARVHSPFRWDERYAQYLQRAGFLDIAVQVVAGVPPMDGPLLTAMVDRWRPETHTFHLPFGEMTITMQDIAMYSPWHRNDAHPTFYYVWKHVQPIRGNPDRRYRAYTNELDVVTQHQLSHIIFSPTCYRDRELWRCTTPMILYYVVEFHMPHRVMIDRRKRYKENDWRVKHAQYLIQWQNTQRCDPEDGLYWRAGPNNEYIRWYCASTRTKVKQSWSNRVRKSCRMNCMSSTDVHHGGNGQGTSLGSRRTPLATPPRTASPSTAAVPSKRSRGKAPASPQASEDSEGNKSEDDDPTYGEELEISGMIDAPPVTQMQGESSQ
uniref:SWIM-type domain-containing protein n=1 Tax=Setaria italica TaxID=4555 RepID=K3Z039_SETIT